MTGTRSSDVGAFGPTPRALLEAPNNTSKTIRNSRSRSTALHVRCPTTYHHSHCSRPPVRCREAGSAVSKDLMELPSTGTRETYATVVTYHTCGCRDNPQQQMAPRRRGSRVPSLRSVLLQPTLIREYHLFLAVRPQSLRDASPGSESSPLGRSLGRRPCARSAIVRWEEATDPQSPEGGSQRACHTEGAHPTASGRFSTVALFKQSYPALAVRKLCLWVASPGDTSEPPVSDRVLGSSPFGNSLPAWDCLYSFSQRSVLGSSPFTLTQRGCLHRLGEVVNVPHHCLVTVSVTVHTGHLGLRIQGLPLPGHHIKLTRHVSYVCGGVVDGEALGEFIATAAVGHLPEKPLGENRRHAGEVVSSVGNTRHFVRARCRSPVVDWCGTSNESW